MLFLLGLLVCAVLLLVAVWRCRYSHYPPGSYTDRAIRRAMRIADREYRL